MLHVVAIFSQCKSVVKTIFHFSDIINKLSSCHTIGLIPSMTEEATVALTRRNCSTILVYTKNQRLSETTNIRTAVVQTFV